MFLGLAANLAACSFNDSNVSAVTSACSRTSDAFVVADSLSKLEEENAGLRIRVQNLEAELAKIRLKENLTK